MALSMESYDITWFSSLWYFRLNLSFTGRTFSFVMASFHSLCSIDRAIFINNSCTWCLFDNLISNYFMWIELYRRTLDSLAISSVCWGRLECVNSTLDILSLEYLVLCLMVVIKKPATSLNANHEFDQSTSCAITNDGTLLSLNIRSIQIVEWIINFSTCIGSLDPTFALVLFMLDYMVDIKLNMLLK